MSDCAEKPLSAWRDEALDLRAQLRLLNSMIRRTGYEVGALGAERLKPVLGSRPCHLPPYWINMPECPDFHLVDRHYNGEEIRLVVDTGGDMAEFAVQHGSTGLVARTSDPYVARQIAYRLLDWADKKTTPNGGE